MTRRASDSSRRVRHLVRSIAAAHKIHPNKTIVLKGVDNDLFWNGVYDRPQLALGWTGLYVTNDTQQVLIGSFDRNDIADRLLPDAVTLEAIRKGSAVVYDASEGRLRNITTTYGRVLALDPNLPLPSLIDAGNPLYSKFLKEGWYPPSKGRAWTERSATVELRGPSAARGKLLLRAVLSPRHTQDGPITVSASVDGSLLGSRPIALGQTSCDLSFDLPDTLVGQHAMRVTIMVDRTVVSPPDTRAVGLLFGTIEVTP
jgi:hypothetical protein